MLEKLQNGSDIRGISIESEENPIVNLTNKETYLLTIGFIKFLAKKTGKDIRNLIIAVGNDSRISADSLKSGIFAGAEKLGVKIYDTGLSSTPAMFMATIFDEFSYDGTIMVTASHLPYDRNGMKFFTKEGGVEKEDITEIVSIANKEEFKEEDLTKGNPLFSQVKLMDVYSEFLAKKIRDGVNASHNPNKPLKGLKIVVDAGNGAGGFFVSKVIDKLGADTRGSLYLQPDGMFPNHIPNPEDKDAINSIKQGVLNAKADFGIIFDTDVDRMAAVLGDGEVVNKDANIAMMAAILAKDNIYGTIVTDSVVSDRLTEFLEENLHMKHHIFKRGYRNVINEAIRLNEEGIEAPLAIETSGHGAFKENYFLDDGAYMAVKLIIAAAKAKKNGKDLTSYIDKLKEGFEEREYRIKINCEDYKEYGKNVLEEFEKRAISSGYFVAKNAYEGVRISFKQADTMGWTLLRMSLHEPKMPLNIEGSRQGDCDRIFACVKKLLAGFDKLEFDN
ncbi:Phosphomannomutase [Acetitomaculum ruminis DSM 5522]|uniref:Phosphomannomutase n=1 Tax=Acetitomaculum ruminis DSM 5522 TaxID=1120918 RepID=A0A1I0VT66_9FIRM|nr:phosphomannomutase/phosphoglucomutase [Acetitomaculum ruminis]SFA79591.1 Phosphomannomutase [Acetitomaculum ruminis DSM 5522]